MSASSPERLDEYRRKRDPQRTPEPFGPSVTPGAAIFVVQHHAARRVHFDLRLEVDGVLWSWAVPKGPSPNPADKRLAVKVEDHPLDYADFEGRIPQGNYGAGAVIVWDKGTWRAKLEPNEGLEKGKLLFELRGYKLRGMWTLVKTRRGDKDWLFIKERDEWVNEVGHESYPADSIYSGLTVEELQTGTDHGKKVRAKLKRSKAPRLDPTPRHLKVMLAETAEQPFSRKGWFFEIKYDGYRLLAARRDEEVSLTSRNGVKLTGVFPEIAKAVDALPYADLLIDAEVVVNDEHGLPSFQLLQQRAKLTRKSDVERAKVELPATLYVFDLLALEKHDLRGLALRERIRLLKDVLPSVGPLRYSEHVEADGEAMYNAVCNMRLEGIVAKNAQSPYRAGRSSNWLKIVAQKRDDFVIVGYTPLKGAGEGVGALHLGQYADGVLRYAGRVGSGFRDNERALLRSLMETAPPAAPPEGAPRTKADYWVAPAFVCEVKFKVRTNAGRLRQPVFLKLRDDKAPEECIYRPSRAARRAPPATAPVPREAEAEERVVRLSNVDKVFWPERGYTKGDLLAYYEAVAEWLLPYLKDRPVLLTRYPDGIDGKSFFQLDAPDFVPDWIRVERVKNQGVFVIDDVETLLYLVNLGTIPLHIWSSRIGTLDRPDWCILDLDPKQAQFAHVATIAKAIHKLCSALDLPSYVKSSGSTGLHVLVPLGGQVDHAQSRLLGELLAHVCVSELPAIATVTRTVSKRDGRVYIDYGQNGEGKTLVSPYCVRPLPEASVAMPLTWRQVTRTLDVRRYTMKNAVSYLRKRGKDPMIDVLVEKPDLALAVARLEQRLAKT